MSKGFGGIPGNLQGLMKQAQKMQEQLQKAQEEAASIVCEGSSGGGMVKVSANGENRLVAVEIEKEVVDPGDVEMLEDLILTACNEALKKAGDAAKEKLQQATGGLNFPGLF